MMSKPNLLLAHVVLDAIDCLLTHCSLSMSVLAMLVSCAKTAEPIDGVWRVDTYGPRNHALDIGLRYPHDK